MLKKVNQEREVRLNAGRTTGQSCMRKHLATMKAKAFDCRSLALERKEIIALLAERISQLPALQKKVLAMYYCEKMQLSEIAAIFGVADSRIFTIRGQALAVLRKYLVKLLTFGS
jgi:RNA polymerase sigma factor (sigma-70 family)